jgi:hypothetical protein
MARTETVLEPTTLRETLRIYNVHESGQQETTDTDTYQQNSPEQSTTHPDPNWPADWRRMPPYRESSRTHRVSDRPAGQDAVEGAVVVTMFSGVWLLGVRKANTQMVETKADCCCRI